MGSTFAGPIPSPLQGIDVPLTDRHGVLTPTQLTSARATLPTGGTGGQEVTKTLLSDEKTQDSVTVSSLHITVSREFFSKSWKLFLQLGATIWLVPFLAPLILLLQFLTYFFLN